MTKYIIFLLLSFIFLRVNAQTYFSVQTHFGQIDRPDIDSASVVAMLDGIKSAGIKMIRDECYWSIIETTRGIYTFPPLFDFYIQSAKQRGIDVLLILNYNNPLYAAHAGAAVTTDSNRIAYANYCKKVVERYSPLGVKHYEIWNEPNIPIFWDPAPNAIQYKLLLQAAYPAIKSVDSSVTVMGCATSPAEGNPAPYISWLSFIQQVYNAGGGAFMDAVSFHQYRVDKAPETYLYNDINNLKAITGAKPVYLTEIGYPTSSVWPNVPQQKQAEYLARTYLLGTKNPELKMISWYDYKNDGLDPANNEHNFGIVNFDLSPKPAYIYYQTMRNSLTSKAYTSSTVTNGAYSYMFGSAPTAVWAFWHESASATLQYNFGQSRILKVTPSSGNEYYINDANGIIPVYYSTSPVYYSSKEYLPADTYYGIIPEINNVVVNQKVNFAFRGLTPDGKTVFIDSSLVNWSVVTQNGQIDSLGRFRAISAGICTVKGIYNGGEYSRTFLIQQSYSNLEIEPFNAYSQFTFSFFNQLDTVNFQAITDTSYTTPPSALLLKYRFRYQGIDKHRFYMDCNYNLLGEPDSMMMDVYGNGNGHVINFRIEDADGQLFSVNTPSSALTNQYGWRTVKAALNKFGSSFNYPAKLTRITVYTVKTGGMADSIYSGTILLDNLRIHNGIPVSIIPIKEIYRISHAQIRGPYPNPVSSSNQRCILNITASANSEAHFSLYDISGKILMEKEFRISEADNNLEIDVMELNLASGVYLYTLRLENQQISGKFIYIK